MNKEARDYMSEKVTLYDSLKNSMWWLNNARTNAKVQRLVIGGVEVNSRCSKDIVDHLIDAIQSLLATEIQEIDRKMEEI